MYKLSFKTLKTQNTQRTAQKEREIIMKNENMNAVANNEAKKNASAMNALKRARTLNFYNEETRCTETVKIVAESEKAYKTDSNKVLKKVDVEKRQQLKNTIDYRFNTTEEDEKYTKVQERLCKLLDVALSSDIRVFEDIFAVRETKRYYNILVSDSVILNRASSIELLLTEADNEKVKAHFETVLVEKTETKLDKYMKHYKENTVYSVVLKTKEDIQRVAKLLK